ncbi:hypothetical protein [Vibrio sp. NH-UV-68]|uniref:hypothetical protein n=3 Tax=Vibrio TaxID=662 RepID=UPI0036F20B80
MACISFTADPNWFQSLLVSVAAACIFDTIITIVPKEQQKVKAAIKVAEIIGEISEVKNSNLSNIQYQPNFWSMNYSSWKDDMAMCKEKAEKINRLLRLNGGQQHVEHLNHLIPCKGDNWEYINLSFSHFRNSLRKLNQLASDDNFPLLFDAVQAMQHQIDNHVFIRRTGQLDDRLAISHYIHMVEELEFWNKVETVRYNLFESGFYRTRLLFTDEFIIRAFSKRAGSYI